MKMVNCKFVFLHVISTHCIDSGELLGELHHDANQKWFSQRALLEELDDCYPLLPRFLFKLSPHIGHVRRHVVILAQPAKN